MNQPIRKRLFSRTAATLLTILLTSVTAWADDVTVTSSTTSWADGNTYNVTNNVTITSRINVNGTVTLNLGEGYTLTAKKGIELSNGNSLTINGPGSLTIDNCADYNAGIGATEVGTLIINGGTITAEGGSLSAGIGGNNNNTIGGTITINGGIVNATGNSYASGIGGGAKQSAGGICGTITINGGQVTANGGYGAPGIGGGTGASNSGTVTLGWTNSDDFIQASYARISTLQFATGKQFYLDGTKTVATTDNISGKKIKPMTDVVKKNLDYATISNLASPYLHTGSAIALGYTVTAIDGTELTKNTHFTQSLTCNGAATSEVNSVGAYTLTLTGTGDYTGSVSANFDVLASLSGAGTESQPYIINSTEDWATFSVEAFAGTYWTNGVYVKLSDTWDNSSDAVTTTVGTSDHKFQGHFLGNGKTLTVNLSATTDNCAPFGYINGATIQDLTIAGSITTTAKYAASIAAHTSGTTNITNCQSTATITSTATSSGDGTHGGFVAVNEGSATLYFTNCVFKGKMLGGNATSNGGFVGYNGGTKIYYTDCFFAPTELTMSASSSSTFNRNGKNELTRCYYTASLGTAEGTQVFTTPQSICKRLTLDGSDYYAMGTAVITTDKHYDYNGGSAITVTPAITYDGTPLDADCYTATITKDGNPVTTVADKGCYTLTIIGNTSNGYYGAKSINFYVMADLSGSGTSETPYLIDDAADWEKFVANINGGTNADKYYKLTADIVGIESMAGTSTNKFSGTFDGNGKTLTLSLTTDGSEYTAPFRYVNGATISLLTTAGYVDGGNQKYATGLIGNSVGTVSITACRSSVAISSSVSGDGTHGGFIGVQSSGEVTFTNCLFDGSITGSNTTNCGGFVGWRNATLTFNNCLMAGTMTLSTNSGSATFNRNGSSTLNSCYYRNDYGGSQGTAVGTMTNAELATALGSGWEVIGSDVLPIMGDKDLGTATISGVSATYNYSGTPIEITYTVTAFGGATLTKGTHYTATIDGNDVTTVSTAGIHTLTITAKDGSGYTGSHSVSFRVFVPIAYQQYDTTNKELTNQTVSAGDYTLMTSTTTGMNTGWYVVNEDVTVGSRITVNGDVNLILCDGVTLTASRGIVVRSGKSLTIYSQSGNTGVLTAHAYGNYGSAIGESYTNAGTITIHGGEINATSHGDASMAIGGNNGTVTIYGGRISASYDVNGYGIGGAGATVNLGWCRSTDNIYAKEYGGTVNLLNNFVFDDNHYQAVTTGNINNRRIVPQNSGWLVWFDSQGGSAVTTQTVANNDTATEPTAPTRTGYTFGGWYTDTDCTDGNAYNFSTAVTANVTLYAKWTLTDFAITLPESFEATVGGNAATTATMGQTVTMSLKSGYTLTGSITATDANSQSLALTNLGNNTYTFTMPASDVNVVAFAGILEPGWTLVGTYKTQNFDTNDTYYYGFVGTTGTGTDLGTFVQVGGYVRVKPMRAYLVAPGGTLAAAPARRASNEQNPTTLRVRLLGSDGQTTGILSVNGSGFTVQGSDAWYTLDGRRIANGQKPTAKGIYINNGKKVVIK